MIVYTQQICNISAYNVHVCETIVDQDQQRLHFAVNTCCFVLSLLCIPAVRHVMSWFLTSKVCYVTRSGESVGAAASQK